MRKGPHPLRFFVLILPYGASFGYVSVALPYIARQHGISVAAIGAVVAAAFAPHGIKFLWAPVVDTTLTKRLWYLIALALIGLGTFASSAMPIRPDTLSALTTVVVASQVGLTLMGMACESFLGHTVPESEKGRAAGWYQAGNFIGLGVGGGAALWLSQHLGAGWRVGAAMGVVMTACALALVGLPEPGRDHKAGLGNAMRALGRDLKRLATSRTGLTGLLIGLSPVGAGAASNYWAALADNWHASAHMVELVTGAVGGVVSGVGCMAGGWLADRMNRRLAYALAGGLTACTGVVMALAPREPWAYAVFSLVYSFFNGLAFAAFAGFVLETIGKGAVATKYNIFASLANVAITYMTRIDGGAHHRWGSSGLLFVDAAVTVGGIGVLLVMTMLVRPRAHASAEAAG